MITKEFSFVEKWKREWKCLNQIEELKKSRKKKSSWWRRNSTFFKSWKWRSWWFRCIWDFVWNKCLKMKSSFDHFINLMLFSSISPPPRPVISEHEVRTSGIFQSSINVRIRKFSMWNRLQIAIRIKEKFNQSNQTDEGRVTLKIKTFSSIWCDAFACSDALLSPTLGRPARGQVPLAWTDNYRMWLMVLCSKL